VESVEHFMASIKVFIMVFMVVIDSMVSVIYFIIRYSEIAIMEFKVITMEFITIVIIINLRIPIDYIIIKVLIIVN
jgi:hypothetical protein